MKKSLKDVPESYFGEFSKNSGNETPGHFWAVMLCCLILMLFYSAAGSNRKFPVMFCFSSAIEILVVLFLIPTFFFSSKKNISRFRRAFVFFRLCGMEIITLSILNFIVSSCVLLCTDGLNEHLVLVPVIYAAAGGLIIENAVMTVLYWKRMKGCIITGNYREGGPGFWTKEQLPKVKKATSIIYTIYGFSITLNAAGILLGKYIACGVTDAEVPAVALFFFLVSIMIMAAIPYNCAKLIGRYVYLRYHGDVSEKTE